MIEASVKLESRYKKLGGLGGMWSSNLKNMENFNDKLKSRFLPEFYEEKRKEYELSRKEIENLIRRRAVIEARVMDIDENYRLHFSLGENIDAYMELRDLEYKLNGEEVSPKSAMIKSGKHIKFVIDTVYEKDGVLMVKCSRRKLQDECYHRFIKKLAPGDVIPARVINITSYGVFCDIGCGLSALLPVEYISVVNTFDIEKNLAVLKTLRVAVRRVLEDGRLVLSHRELLGTWEQEANKFTEGQELYGVVINNESYGSFIRLSQNLSGLANAMEHSLSVGDVAKVKITTINPDSMKVKLHILETKASDVRIDQSKFEYKVPVYSHMDVWEYSTEKAKKRVRTIFD